MKRLLLTTVAALLFAGAASAQINYRIEGAINNLPAGKVFLVNVNKTLQPDADTVSVTDGRFTLSGTANEPGIKYVVYLNAGSTEIIGSTSTPIFIENGTIKVEGDYSTDGRLKIGGTPSNDAFDELLAKSRALLDTINSKSTENITEERRKELRREFDNQVLALTRESVAENRDNLFGVYILFNKLNGTMTGKELLAEFEKFTPEIRNSAMALKYIKAVERTLKRDVGATYTDFSLPAPDSTMVALSSLVGPGKYVLVDFWASWCGPCMAEVPNLKAAYDKYHGKGFEILGVSYDNNKAKWLATIEKYGLNWPHVSALKGWKCPTSEIYGINGIPSSFLVGPDGVIIGGDYRGKALENKLAELFGE